VTALVVSVFIAAFLGSAHCAAMCGGLACFVAGDTHAARATTAYNGGRLIAYAILGAIAGTVGAGFDQAGSIVGIARPAAIVAGVLMIVWGGVTALTAAGVHVGLPRILPAGTQRAIGTVMRNMRDRSPMQRGLTLGLLTPLLPCGWLYAFVMTAAATGSAPRGAFVMAVFWAGTVPAMVALGLGVQRALGPFRTKLPAITAAAMMVIGLLTVVGKFKPGAHEHMHQPDTTATATATAVDGSSHSH
jgi:sulfite exporter TauE/SafE